MQLSKRPLRSGSVRFLGTIGSSVGVQAPTAGVTFLPALMAGIVGASGPLAFALALVAMLFVSYAFTTFTQEFASAGSIYTYNGIALGAAYGFISAWILLAVYIAFASSIYASNTNFVESLLHDAGGSAPWPLVAVAFWLLATVLAYRSISISTALIFLLEGVSLVLIGAVAVSVLVQGGYQGHGLTATPFLPQGASLQVIGLGVIFAFTGFSGFEVAATLGEESKQPTRLIPISILASLLISGGVYVFLAWVETMSFASAKDLAASPVPLVAIARSYISPGMGVVVNLAALISGIGAQLATVNGATRLLFALGRGGFGPGWLTGTHQRHRSPVGALAVVAPVSLVAVLALARVTPLDAFFDLATYGADLIIIAYLLTSIAAFVWSIQHRRSPLRLLLLATGVAVIGHVLKGTVYPLPAFPFNWCIYGAAATITLGCVLIASLPGPYRVGRSGNIADTIQ